MYLAIGFWLISRWIINVFELDHELEILKKVLLLFQQSSSK